MDLHSRKIIGWSMQPTLARGIVLDALLMAVWKRKPSGRVIVHSDQGSQYGSDDWVWQAPPYWYQPLS
jgi:putative transposase